MTKRQIFENIPMNFNNWGAFPNSSEIWKSKIFCLCSDILLTSDYCILWRKIFKKWEMEDTVNGIWRIDGDMNELKAGYEY